jgi:hypothetical protein
MPVVILELLTFSIPCQESPGHLQPVLPQSLWVERIEDSSNEDAQCPYLWKNDYHKNDYCKDL